MISSNHRASLFYKESLCRTLPILKVYMAKDGPQGQIVDVPRTNTAWSAMPLAR